MSHFFKQEIIGIIERDQRAYDVCASAEAEYDDQKSKLIIDLDRFLRLRDVTKEETHLDEPWLPKKNKVIYEISRNEIDSTLSEVFHFWAKTVKASIPDHHLSFP